MSVHGRSFLQYLNEDDDKWYPLPVGDLISLDYTDKVYAPATVELVISNRRMNETLGTDIDASSGKYTVEGEVDKPTFRRYQTIRLLHLPRQLEPTELTHNSAATPVFTKIAHGLNNGDYVNMVNEETGKIDDNLYEVANKSANTFQLHTTGTGSASQTYSTSLVGDGVTQAMLLNEDLTNSETTIDVDTITGGSSDLNTQVSVGSYIQVDDEIMKVTQVGTAALLVVRGALGTTAATHTNNTAVNHARSIFMQMRTDKPMACYFYGKIDSLDVSYSDAVGKTIHIVASDYLRTLATTPVARVIQESTSDCDEFTKTRLTPTEPDAEDDAEEQGKFRNAVYDNAKFSDTLKEIISDWSFGKTLYTDNTNNGSTSIGVAKFEDSTVSFGTGDIARRKSFGGVSTLALQAMTNIAMTERHSNSGAPYYPAEVSYGASGAEVNTGTVDVLIKATDHNYVNGNLVKVTDDNNADVDSGSGTYIEAGAYIVHSVTANNLKIKNLNGDTIQSVANSSTSRSVRLAPEPSGAQGYDFNLDPGLYSTGDRDSAFSGFSTDTHRPHLNYFMRGSRPVDPEATGLTCIYPTGENQSEDDATFGLTKEFILPDFDHGIFDSDLYTQVALSAVDSNGEPSNSNDLGHTLEMLKVNSISNQDYTYANRTADFYKRGASGEEHGQGVFHWNRADDVRTYNWHVTGTNTAALLDELNYGFFGSSQSYTSPSLAKRQWHNAATDGSYLSQGTVGVIEGNWGGFCRQPDTVYDGHNTGIAGYSNLPIAGRPLTAPPNTAGTNSHSQVENWSDAGKVKDMGATQSLIVSPGAVALTGANLIKDIYHCETEGLLGTEITTTGGHNSATSNGIIVTHENHGLETGTLIKITNINGVTTGNVQGIKVNSSPDAPTKANTTGESTRDTGSYYRVERLGWNNFYIQLPQLHHSDYRDLVTGSGSVGAITGLQSFSSTPGGSNQFKYKPVFNVFKEACRVQWQSGYDWTTEEDQTVLRTSITGKGAQSLMISDVVRNDRPYRGLQVNALVAGPASNTLPGADKTSFDHPIDYFVGSDESYSYFGYATVPFSQKADYITSPGNCSDNVERLGDDKDDDVPVLFKYGDYISETRFLYGDSTSENGSVDGVLGVVGRKRVGNGAQGASGGNNAQPNESSQDVFKNVNCKIIERFAEKRSISKTYSLQYNENYQAPNAVRFAAASILSRVLVPARRTTFNIFGYPTIKLTGQAQTGTGFALGDTSGSADDNLLVPAANPISFGGRAGMLVERLDDADGSGGAMVASSLATAIASGGNITAPLDNEDDWDVGDYYRAFIYLRAGNSVRVVHTAAGITGNMIITGLKYSERAGTARTTISTTGYDENFLQTAHPTLGRIRDTITASGSNTQPAVKTARQVIYIKAVQEGVFISDDLHSGLPVVPGDT